MSILLRRSAYALSKPIANMGRVGSVRLYAVGKEQSAQQFEHHPQVEIGDLVTYTDTKGSKSAGYIQKIFEQTGSHANKDQLAEIQNYHTKAVAYTDLKNVQSVARKHEAYKVNTKAATGASTAPANSSQAPGSQNKTAQTSHTTTAQHNPASTPGATQNKTAQTTTGHTATNAGGSAQNKTTQTTTSNNSNNNNNKSGQTATGASQHSAAQVDKAQAAIEQQHLKESAQKLDEQLKSESSPLNADFAPGDIVRYRVAQNFTAAVVLEIVYSIQHDEHGNFHGATKENPMARLENLWTKNISYHHLNVLEHVKRARDVTPGRLAEKEYAVYDKQ